MKRQKRKPDYEAYRKVVARGVALLDALFGKGKWISKIDTKTFDITNANMCVAGQVFAGYFYSFADGLERMDANLKPSQFGFESGSKTSSYDILQKLWMAKFKSLKSR